MESGSHVVRHPLHGRDFRALGFSLSSVLSYLNKYCLRIFDIGRGDNGYAVSMSAHLFPNKIDDGGVTYIDLMSHRHHMSWGKLVDDTRPKDLVA